MHHTRVGARGASPRTLTFPLMKVRPHMYVRVSVRVPRSFPWGDIAWPLLTSRRTCYECQLDFSYFFACNTKFTCLRSWWVDDFDKSVPRTWPVQGSQHFQGVKRRLGNKMSQFGFTCLKLLPSKWPLGNRQVTNILKVVHINWISLIFLSWYNIFRKQLVSEI